MRRSKAIFFLLLLGSLLSGCNIPKKEKEAEPAKGPATTLIGIVEMVNPEQNYVLIRCEQNFAIAPGTELVALDATGIESKLKLTPERKGRYLTADIKDGQPKVTNLVIQRHSGAASAAPLSAPPTVTTLPEAPPLTPIPLDPVTDPLAPIPPVIPAVPPSPAPPADLSELEPPVQ